MFCLSCFFLPSEGLLYPLTFKRLVFSVSDKNLCTVLQIIKNSFFVECNLIKNLILPAQCIWESCTIFKINLNVFIFTLLYGVSKDFIKAFIKSFESPQRSVKTKSWNCFLFLSESGQRVNKRYAEAADLGLLQHQRWSILW